MWAMYGVGNTDGTACATKWVFDDFGSPPGSQTGLAGVYSSPAYGTLAGGLPVVVVGSTDNDDTHLRVQRQHWRGALAVPDSSAGSDADVGAPPTIAEPGVVGTSGSAAFTDGVVYDTGKDAITYALDLQTGQQIWSFSIRNGITNGGGNPAQSGAALVGGFIYLGYGDGMFSLNAVTGALNPNWTTGAFPGTTAATAGVISSPAVSGPAGNQVLIVGDLAGNVDVFNLQTGATEFTSATGGLIFSSAAVSTGQFFIANGGNGNIYAFGSGSAFPSPSVTSVSANHGPAGSTALVTVTGNAFSGSGFTASDVFFNLTDIPASNAYPCLGSTAGCFEVTSPTQIKVDTPTSFGAGTVDISVVTPGGTSAASVADEYTFVAPSAYTALTPFRVCDSRPAGGGVVANQCDTGGKGTLGANGVVNVQITGGVVPAGAQAVVVNLTALDHSTAGTFVSAYPTGGSVPGVSNINVAGGRAEANLAIVQLSASGQMSLFNAAGRADVIADVQGYFSTPPGVNSRGVPQHPAAPHLQLARGSAHRMRGFDQPADRRWDLAQGRALRSAPGRRRRDPVNPHDRSCVGGVQPHRCGGNEIDVPVGRRTQLGGRLSHQGARVLQPQSDPGHRTTDQGDLAAGTAPGHLCLQCGGQHQLRHRQQRVVRSRRRSRGRALLLGATNPDLRYPGGLWRRMRQ